MRIDNMPKDFSPVHFCPVCKSMYSTAKEAKACFNSTPEPARKVGELIVFYPDYGWFDGDEQWVVATSETFHGKKMFAFWFVITAIDSDRRHQVRYHVQTRAFKNGRQGYTYEHGHKWEWKKAHLWKPPVGVIAEASKMVGIKFDNLL